MYQYSKKCNRLKLKILQFMKLNPVPGNRAWVQNEEVSLYLRNSIRYIPSVSITNPFTVITIANISIHPDYQKQGIGTHLISWIHANNRHHDITFIETVINSNLSNKLNTFEWNQMIEESCPELPDYYKFTETYLNDLALAS